MRESDSLLAGFPIADKFGVFKADSPHSSVASYDTCARRLGAGTLFLFLLYRTVGVVVFFVNFIPNKFY